MATIWMNKAQSNFPIKKNVFQTWNPFKIPKKEGLLIFIIIIIIIIMFFIIIINLLLSIDIITQADFIRPILDKQSVLGIYFFIYIYF
jgi:hypothetical protein